MCLCLNNPHTLQFQPKPRSKSYQIINLYKDPLKHPFNKSKRYLTKETLYPILNIKTNLRYYINYTKTISTVLEHFKIKYNC